MELERLVRVKKLATHLWSIEDDTWYRPEDWPVMLREPCQGDEKLLSEVCQFVRDSWSLNADVGGEVVLPGESIFEDPQVIDRYKVIRRIGSGGMGIVYEARLQVEDGELPVALKLIKIGFDTEMFVRRFRNERHLLSKLTHKNIVGIRDAGSTPEGRPYFTMDLIEGIPIDEYCVAKQLSTKEKLQMFKVVCQAVAYAHSQSIIHRDLKPANILVDRFREPKLLDFGLAKLLTLTDQVLAPSFAKSAVVPLQVGTELWMSPEQKTGGLVSYASDVYGLGLILKALIPSPEGTANPNGIDQLVDRALRPNPAERYGNAGEFLAAVENVLDSPTVFYVPGPEMMGRRKKLLVTVCLATVAVLTLWTWQRMRPQMLPVAAAQSRPSQPRNPEVSLVPMQTFASTNQPLPSISKGNPLIQKSQPDAIALARRDCESRSELAFEGAFSGFIKDFKLVPQSASETVEQMLRRYALGGHQGVRLELANFYLLGRTGVIQRQTTSHGSSLEQDPTSNCGDDIFSMEKAEESVSWLSEEAERGCSRCAVLLGLALYFRWGGVLENPWNSFQLFSKATAAGNAAGHYGLGILYGAGKGVTKDASKAIEHWKTGANMDEINCQLELAELYADGRGVPKDYSLAHFWANIAASNPQHMFLPGTVDKPGFSNETRLTAGALRDRVEKFLSEDELSDVVKRAGLWAASNRAKYSPK